jgi:hypothetical protein
VPPPKLSKNYLFTSIGVGLIYGMGFRWLLLSKAHLPPVMSTGFVLGVPFAIGFVSVYLAERKERQQGFLWILIPWIPVLLSLLGSMVVAWEGSICIAMFAPIAMLMSSIGGVIGGLCARDLGSRGLRNSSLVFAMVLPFFVGPIGQRYFVHDDLRTVATSIDINAPAAIIWQNIERVPSIHSDELPHSWSRRIGFPAPDEATLSYEGVGGVRHATFAGGVLLIETVDKWEPDHRLAFSIHAETERIPATTLDEHVRLGGPYFDVLHGEYELEPLPNGSTRLHLASRHRVTTDFNWYAELWTDAVMSDIQNSILHVIKNRCERHK